MSQEPITRRSGSTAAHDALSLPTTDTFDPKHVPVFPILTLELTTDGGVRLGGRQLPVEAGQDPVDVALAAAADEARLLPGDLGAIRVRGIDTAGNVFPMVVRADGRAYDLPEPAPGRRSARPPWALPAAAAATALVIAGAVTGTVLAIQQPAAPPAAAPAVPALPGAGSPLPVPAPPGYGQQARWAVPVSKEVKPVAGPDKTLLVADSQGRLALLDAATGRPRWIGSDAPRTGDLHVLLNAGQAIAATSSGSDIKLWPLPFPPSGAGRYQSSAASSVAPTTVKLPANAKVSFAGPAPLITLPDQTAAMVRRGAVARVDVPVGAAAIAADADSVTAVTAAGVVYDLAPGAKPRSTTLRRTLGAVGPLVRVIGAGAGRLVAIWSAADKTQRVVLYDARTGQVITSARTGAQPGDVNADVLRDDLAQQLVIGSTVVKFGNRPYVKSLPNRMKPAQLTAGHVYGELQGAPVDVSLAGRALTPTPMSQPVPLGGADTGDPQLPKSSTSRPPDRFTGPVSRLAPDSTKPHTPSHFGRRLDAGLRRVAGADITPPLTGVSPATADPSACLADTTPIARSRRRLRR